VKRAIFGVRDRTGTVLLEGPPVAYERPGATSTYDVWAAAPGMPVLDVEDITASVNGTMDLGPGGSVFRVASIPPTPADAEPGSGMHRTRTIDYGVVLSGRITVRMEDGSSSSLEPGDCFVQIGARHEWRNPGPDACTIAFFVVGVDPKAVRRSSGEGEAT
jgi:mannose-6-phosphate isomerase-like protein (cupin superfamily)